MADEPTEQVGRRLRHRLSIGLPVRPITTARLPLRIEATENDYQGGLSELDGLAEGCGVGTAVLEVSVTREVIWSGHDQTFVAAIAFELGILVDAEHAIVSIMRIDHTVQVFTVTDEDLQLSLIAGPNRVEVQRSVVGAPGEAVVDLNEARATRIRLHCHALVDRIQVRGDGAGSPW